MSIFFDWTFEWDEAKARANIIKHQISFDESTMVFQDPFSITIKDLLHSDEEERYSVIGCSSGERLFVVVFTERANRIRIISSRRATASERKIYEQS